MIKLRPGTMDSIIAGEIAQNPYYAREYIKDYDLVLDGGANIGAFARFVLEQAPHSKIICIEPIPNNLEALRENLENVGSCIIINAALMGSAGTATIYDFGLDASACHSVFDLEQRGAKSVEAPAVTLAEIFKRQNLSKIDFCKLDVQGAEYDILTKSPIEVLDKINYISMELHASIAKDGIVIGDIPDYGGKIAEIVRCLSKSHVLLRGIPVGNSVSLWKNKRHATSVELLKGRVKTGFSVVFLMYQRFRSMAKKALGHRIAK